MSSLPAREAEVMNYQSQPTKTETIIQCFSMSSDVHYFILPN